MKKVLLFIFLLSNIIMHSQISFQEEAANLGLVVNCGISDLGNGITFYDYNQDGWDDIALTTEAGQPIRFFKNENGFFF